MNESKDSTHPDVDVAILGDGLSRVLASIPRFVVRDTSGGVMYETSDYLDAVTFAGSAARTLSGPTSERSSSVAHRRPERSRARAYLCELRIQREEGGVMKIAGVDYVTGQDRNEPSAVFHLYEGTFGDPGNPMCVRGWNRVNGFGYSIFRNNTSGPPCQVCFRRAAAHLPSAEPRERKTKWL